MPAPKTNVSDAVVCSLKFANNRYPKFESIIAKLKAVAFMMSFTFEKYIITETIIIVINGNKSSTFNLKLSIEIVVKLINKHITIIVI